VLAGMDDLVGPVIAVITFCKGSADDCQLYELRPGSDDRNDAHLYA